MAFQEKGAPIVSVDTVGAGEGEIAVIVGGSSSRQTTLTDGEPADNAIIAIIEAPIDIRRKRIFTKDGGARQMELIEKISAAGVVGAGGAGFPTHVELKCQAERYYRQRHRV